MSVGLISIYMMQFFFYKILNVFFGKAKLKIKVYLYLLFIKYFVKYSKFYNKKKKIACIY